MTPCPERQLPAIQYYKTFAPLDFHTHNLNAPLPAIINIPDAWLLNPELAQLREHATYSAGLHPWNTADTDTEVLWQGVCKWAHHPQIVAIGECGLDKLRGASIDVQTTWLERHIMLSEALRKPLTLHCVKAFDEIIALKKRLTPTQQWTIHGFRGKPEQARQLIAQGFHLSFGKHYNEAAFGATPAHCRHLETDDAYA